MTLRRTLNMLVCVAVLTGGAISLATGPLARAQAQTPTLPPGLTAVSPPKPLPAFSLPGVNGPTLQSGELKGKVVVLRFWATH